MRMAASVLERHLKIEEKPVLSNATLQRECIPQYHVGHDEKLRRAHEDLMRGFKGRVGVAGSSFGGVGLNDCVMSARGIAREFAKGIREGREGVTGLEGWVGERTWVRKK